MELGLVVIKLLESLELTIKALLNSVLTLHVLIVEAFSCLCTRKFFTMFVQTTVKISLEDVAHAVVCLLFFLVWLRTLVLPSG